MHRSNWFLRACPGIALTLVASIAESGPIAGRSSPLDPHQAVAAQLAAEVDVVNSAILVVQEKLRLVDAVRSRRLIAAIRGLHSSLRSESTPQERMVVARRRAAARFLLSRDAAERRLLRDELSHLRADATRIVAAASGTFDVPTEWLWPARGVIGRQFGQYVHERSNAILTRRGIDIIVEPRARVVAPARGVVRYAGAIRGLDRGAIIDLGSYFAVVAKLGDVAVPVGARVSQGDLLGHAADHRIYLEMRVKVGAGGMPLDPLPLLRSAPQQ